MTGNKIAWEWVHDHEADDPARLALGTSAKQMDFDIRQAIVQIQARQKFGKKLKSTLNQFPDFYFPGLLNGEQCTSDLLATYHSTLVGKEGSLVDLTAGLGIDAMHMARRMTSVTAVEQDPALTQALDYNATGIGIDNIKTVTDTCENFIERCISEKRRFDVAFIDPARRGDHGQRLYALTDCSPDVVKLLPDIARIADRLIIKMSPMLDISSVIADLPVTPATIVAAGTPSECKELLALIDFKTPTAETLIKAVTLPDTTDINFTMTKERNCPLPPVCESPREGGYIYEPYPAVMKTGAFRLLGEQFRLSMFHANTKVFYSDEPKQDFPGNSYIIEKVLPYASRIIKRFSKDYPRINVTVRNFGMSADALRQKLGVRDSGDRRLFALGNHRNERILVVTKMATAK